MGEKTLSWSDSGLYAGSMGFNKTAELGGSRFAIVSKLLVLLWVEASVQIVMHLIARRQPAVTHQRRFSGSGTFCSLQTGPTALQKQQA